jgi:hypothetical protein
MARPSFRSGEGMFKPANTYIMAFFGQLVIDAAIRAICELKQTVL